MEKKEPALKNAVAISIYGLTLLMMAGCGGRDERSYEEPHRTGVVPETVRAADNPEFFESERDSFHPGSRFESLRKNRLTDFGFREIDPPLLTPNAHILEQTARDEGFSGVMVTGFKMYTFQEPAFPFDYENDISRLKKLAADHGLDTIIDSDASELDNLAALMQYTYRFLDGGTMPEPDDDRGPSAEYITRRRREENIGGDSRHYAALFCQLALAAGFDARLVGMHTFGDDGVIQTHTICEVYLNSYAKWAAFDPCSRATYYVREGTPQSALELRTLMLDNNYRAIQAYSHIGDITAVSGVKEGLLPRYRYLYIWRMNDMLSKSPANGTMSWQELYETHLVWEDGRSLVRNGRFDEVPAFSDTSDPLHPLNGVRYVAHNVDDFNWRLNYVIMNLVPHDGDMTAYFTTVTPNFKEYLIDDKGLLRTTDNIYTLQSVGFFFIVTPVNEFDMPGTKSYVDFSY